MVERQQELFEEYKGLSRLHFTLHIAASDAKLTRTKTKCDFTGGRKPTGIKKYFELTSSFWCIKGQLDNTSSSYIGNSLEC